MSACKDQDIAIEKSISMTHNKCVTTRHILVHIAPAFMRNNYVQLQGRYQSSLFYGGDPLWDEAVYRPLNRCCTFNNPPWFYKELPEPTTDDIEMRVCRDEGT